MTGLDKIIGQITASANEQEFKLLNEAKRKAESILKEGQNQAEELCMEIAKKSREDINNYRERVKTSADFQRRTALLKAKQEIVATVIEKAYQSLATMDDASYFAFLEKMVQKFSLPRDGVIHFSQKDINRMPTDFEAAIQTAAIENGGNLALAKEPKGIADGFVLVYEGIEENCTLRAVFDARMEHLQDRAGSLLFARQSS